MAVSLAVRGAGRHRYPDGRYGEWRLAGTGAAGPDPRHVSRSTGSAPFAVFLSMFAVSTA
jgi:hypothetical protein